MFCMYGVGLRTERAYSYTEPASVDGFGQIDYRAHSGNWEFIEKWEDVWWNDIKLEVRNSYYTPYIDYDWYLFCLFSWFSNVCFWSLVLFVACLKTLGVFGSEKLQTLFIRKLWCFICYGSHWECSNGLWFVNRGWWWHCTVAVIGIYVQRCLEGISRDEPRLGTVNYV